METRVKFTVIEAGQTFTCNNGREAVLKLVELGIIEQPETKRYNPMMKLSSARKAGLITFEVEMSGAAQPKPQTTKSPMEQVLEAAAEQKSENGVAKPAEQLALALQAMLNQTDAKVSPEMVREIVKQEIQKLPAREIVIKIGDKPQVKMDRQHKCFDDILALLALRMNVWLTGGAGSGKTTAAHNAATALGLPFYSVSVCAQTTESKLFGYMDANGRYVDTLFYRAYTTGGVFLLDEVDNGNANVMAAMNAALANGQCAFPNGMADKHEDFVLVAAANTIGTGGNLQYVGRNRIDAATIDRFAFIEFGYDEELELEISPDRDFTRKVQALRAKAVKHNMSVIVSPRISISGGLMIKTGMREDKVLDILLYNKLSKAERDMLTK
jgi:cobaltochelatase CobS